MSDVLVNGLFGIAGAVVGSIITWVLTVASENRGKLRISISNAAYDNDGGTCTINFEVVVFNDKRDKSGINGCKVVADYDTGTRTDFLPVFKTDEDRDEFSELLNIDAKTFRMAKYHKSGIEQSGNTKYYFGYRLNGQKKIRKIHIKF